MPIITSNPTTIYRLFGARDELLYVGVSTKPDRRLEKHRKEQPWADEIERMEIGMTFRDRAEAEQMERRIIIGEAPQYNKVHSQRQVERGPFLKVDQAITIIELDGSVTNGGVARDDGTTILVEEVDGWGFGVSTYTRIEWRNVRRFILGVRDEFGELLNNDEMLKFESIHRQKYAATTKETT